jgi:phage terminase small subunit
LADKPKRIIPARHEKFIENYLRTGEKKKSAVAAGYPPASAANAATLIMSTPAAQEAIQASRAAVMKKAEYSLEQSVKQIEDGIRFAIKTGNANAYAKFTELKMKAFGLLEEKINIRQSGFSIVVNLGDEATPTQPTITLPPLTKKEEDDDDIFD